MSAPIVPQRPARSQDTAMSSQSSLEPPRVPPRPTRLTERSISRDREASTRSPLNDTGFSSNGASHLTPHASEAELKRPPSVAHLPMIGQEGNEYASLDDSVRSPNADDDDDDGGSPSETRNVASDLPLHAPKASTSPAVARTRVATVTRTDTAKASIAGVGKPTTEVNDASDSAARSPSAGRFRPPSNASTERPGSAQLASDDHEGIPSFGVTVPMYPNAGDVQAPTPGPTQGTFPGGVSNDGSRPPTGDGRKRTAHGYHGPPGAYGLHGHGVAGQDRFEKSWYEKHPDELAKEELETHKPASALERPSWAMSSDELNKLVHDSGRNTPGFGTNPEMIGTPTEAIGYQASLEYTNRNKAASGANPQQRTRTSRPSSQSYAESPLRKSFSATEESRASDTVEDDSDNKHHVDPPRHRVDKVGVLPVDRPTADLGPHGGNTEAQGGWIHERGTGTPILASDELMKDRGSEYLQPAVSPAQPLSEDDYYSGQESDAGSYRSARRNRSGPNSRPSSRPNSVHMHSHHGLSRFTSHEFNDGIGTPLEEIEEYEPLFKDDDKGGPEKMRTATSRLNRPDVEKRRFPSQDIWEDTPTSLQLQTTVDTPEEPRSPESAKSPQKTASASRSHFELPEKEQRRRGEVTEAERDFALRDPTKAKPKFNPAVMHDRPGLPQRFPSRDLWEDTPDSLSLTTTVGEMNGHGVRSPTSPQDRSAAPAGSLQDQAKAGPGVLAVPARPQRQQASQSISPTERKAPLMPERPKPQVPQRPMKKSSLDRVDASAGSATSSVATSTREKPAVPARPAGGSKFASIKAGFMSDLNSRLQLGPQPPTKPQTEERAIEEAAPLEDARKGRARGPARRKPAVSPAAGQTKSSSKTERATVKCSVSSPRTLWSIDTIGSAAVSVPTRASTAPTSSSEARTTLLTAPADLNEHPTASPLARNTAGESLISKSEAPETASGALAHEASPEMDLRAAKEDGESKARGAQLDRERIGFVGDVPEPHPDTGREDDSTPLAIQKSPDTGTEAGNKEAQDEVEEMEAAGAPLEPQTSTKTGIELPEPASSAEAEVLGAPIASVASSGGLEGEEKDAVGDGPKVEA